MEPVLTSITSSSPQNRDLQIKSAKKLVIKEKKKKKKIHFKKKPINENIAQEIPKEAARREAERYSV
jgi:hypothetical protein